MSGFPVCVRGPVGSVQGVSEAFPGGRESRFRESLRVLNAFLAALGGLIRESVRPFSGVFGTSSVLRRFIGGPLF